MTFRLASAHLEQDESADVRAISPPGHHYVIKACRSESQTLVLNLVQFTSILLILGTMKSISPVYCFKKCLIPCPLTFQTGCVLCVGQVDSRGSPQASLSEKKQEINLCCWIYNFNPIALLMS